ncbi:MAG: adenylyltransferase/cytidyltransferase family protein [Candidatus Eisenbacteria bacterium]|uniref:Adenylyltransferase/cytidyltransferase family protein n=1 Tax=Eiseniibacteriota bacterium TaxID=2212470 RepID=A0A849SRE6_UNCEI|nr:adenylyltransferase/cytidyltransferase family protein [Candidatus Eisenbacteria bacterium]
MSESSRVTSRPAARELVASWREDRQRVVFANGVFDLLHVGHLRYLEGARALGQRLVVAVNGDHSTAAHKGPGRPVVPALERAALVASLRCVDAVVIFDEPTVDALLRELRPDVHAKGTDYVAEGVPERATMRALGGETAITGDAKAHASRDLVERIRRGGREPR